MTIEKTQNGNQLCLKVSGRLDTSTAPQLEAVINDDLANVTDLTFDCADLEYISSAGLRVLLKAQKKMNVVGTMKVIHVPRQPAKVLRAANLHRMMTITYEEG